MKVNTLKSIVLILLSSFIGIVSNPEILTASDSVVVSGIDDSRAVLTVVSETVETPAAPEAGEVATYVAPAPTTPVVAVASTPVKAPAPVAKAPSQSVKFSWGVQELFDASSTSVNAGNKVARRGKLIWGHNYTDFGKITSLKIGDTFTITENGATATYKVAANPINGSAGVVLDKKSDAILSYAANPKYDTIDMSALIKYGMGHSLALMTCYGSNSRYVVVADRI